MTTINAYRNGNCSVELLEDGTKIREWSGEAFADHPESMDLKITDYCDAGCHYCHESSTKRGRHGRIEDILRVTDHLPAGVEIAIGGGNPLSHPDLIAILEGFKFRGLVSNLTVNAVHIEQYRTEIELMRRRKLIHGLGISWEVDKRNAIIGMIDANTVLHFIAGIHSPADAIRLLKQPIKILVLGYKRFGFGLKCNEPNVDAMIAAWRYWIGSIMRHPNCITSFDNLAIEQLGVRKILTTSQWDNFYMGDDGRFTMYVDAVRNEFAVSSTSPRRAIEGRNIREMFKLL